MCLCVHVCGSFIKGLPYEDASCESRNTQRDLALVEAHTQTYIQHVCVCVLSLYTEGTKTGKGREEMDMMRSFNS